VALLGRNDLDAVGESDTSDHLRQLICAFQSAAGSGRRVDHFEHHQPAGLRRQRSLGSCAAPWHALDRIGGSQVDPVLRKEVIERSRSSRSLFKQSTARAYLAPYFSAKAWSASSATARLGAIAMSCRAFFMPLCAELGTLLSTLTVLRCQRRRRRAPWKTSPSAFQKPRGKRLIIPRRKQNNNVKHQNCGRPACRGNWGRWLQQVGRKTYHECGNCRCDRELSKDCPILQSYDRNAHHL
jgi:hypothetical protein